MNPKLEPSQGTVLVVDDAPDTVRMLCDALADEGYTVLVARDGQQREPEGISAHAESLLCVSR